MRHEQTTVVHNQTLKEIDDEFRKAAREIGQRAEEAAAALKPGASPKGYSGGLREAWDTRDDHIDRVSQPELSPKEQPMALDTERTACFSGATEVFEFGEDIGGDSLLMFLAADIIRKRPNVSASELRSYLRTIRR